MSSIRIYQKPNIVSPIPVSNLSIILNKIKEYKHIDLEIGCGVGWHGIQRSILNPDRLYIGVEPNKKRIDKFRVRFNSHNKPKNLIIERNRIEIFMPQLGLENFVDNIFILYPTPYMKNKTKSKRWHLNPFMKMMIKYLKPGGQIIVATNIEDYAQECEESMTQNWKLKLVHKTTLNLAQFLKSKQQYRTHFEKKYLLSGQNIHLISFSKESLH